MPSCLKCGTELAVNEEGIAPVLCDRCAGVASSRARRTVSTGTMRDFPATVTLMAINLAVFAGMVVTGGSLSGFSGQELVRWGGNFGPLTTGGEYWRLVTAGFVHASFLHIALNMWCLFSLGRLSEQLFGKWQTFFIYLLTGVGGALLSIAYDPGRLSVGASGAIFGIAGAVIAGLKFGNLAIAEGQRRSILSSVVMFSLFNFWFGRFGNTDNMCHLGGFVTGLIIGLPLGAFARNHKIYQLSTLVVTALVLSAAGNELAQTHGGASELYRAQVAARQKDYPKAIQIMEKYTAAKPEDEQAWLLLGDLYAVSGEKEKASAAYERVLKVNPNSSGAKDALEELRGNTPSEK